MVDFKCKNYKCPDCGTILLITSVLANTLPIPDPVSVSTSLKKKNKIKEWVYVLWGAVSVILAAFFILMQAIPVQQ